MEQHPPTIFIVPEPPPFPAPPRSVDLSSLQFILALIALITIPALIYTFFFSVKCPPAPFRRRRQTSTSTTTTPDTLSVNNDNPTDKVAADVKYKKDAHVKDFGSECPICLSVFADGEEVKQLSGCKHSFHASCIDMWLNSHSNCPVCRASVDVKRPNGNGSVNSSARRGTSTRDSDLHQGLPDAASLV